MDGDVRFIETKIQKPTKAYQRSKIAVQIYERDRQFGLRWKTAVREAHEIVAGNKPNPFK